MHEMNCYDKVGYWAFKRPVLQGRTIMAHQTDLAWHFCYAAAKTPLCGVLFQIWESICPSWPAPAWGWFETSSNSISRHPKSKESDCLLICITDRNNTAECLIYSKLYSCVTIYASCDNLVNSWRAIKHCNEECCSGGRAHLQKQSLQGIPIRRPSLFVQRSHLLQ